ncbi:MAG: sigma-70 family RNA polymerase sigma factor [Phycisphaerales bacterium]
MSRPKTAASITDSSSTGDRWKLADDPALIQACLEDNQGAWAELISRYGRLVYSIPRRYGLDAPSSEDVFQEVFSILLAQLGGIRNRRAIPKWLITTTQRVCRQAIKRARSSGEELPDAADTVDPPLERILRWERQHVVRQALRRLSGQCEELLTALYLNQAQASYTQVGEQLRMSVGSIGPTRARCLKKLLEIIQAMDADDVL